MENGRSSEASSLKHLLDQYERQLIEEALAAAAGNQRRAAAALGVLPTTLHEKMKRLGLRPKSARHQPAHVLEGAELAVS
jgi:DNA-binding NtrC family response regulator